MAVNLLSLARSSSSGLHNSGRGGGRSYAPGTSYGNKIPGTNISQGSGLKNLAKKGRSFGGVKDSKIRKVKGETSHVNKHEANVIDVMGPLGEAWVASIGSGTINPKTGLREYGLFKSNPFKRGGALSPDSHSGSASLFEKGKIGMSMVGTWRPSQGKWGIFGQTKASKERDRKKAEANDRHKAFETFRRTYEDENIAGIFTEDVEGVPSDDTDLTAPYAQDFNNFIKTESGMNTPDAFISENDISDYTDPYDPRGEDEALADLERQGEELELKREGLNLQRAGVNASNAGTGTQLSSGLFGMLTQSNEKKAEQGFAGAGDFGAEFEQKTAVRTAEQQFADSDRNREQLDLDEGSLDIEDDQLVADAVTAKKDIQEAYNQEFWTNMVGWDSAVNA